MPSDLQFPVENKQCYVHSGFGVRLAAIQHLIVIQVRHRKRVII